MRGVKAVYQSSSDDANPFEPVRPEDDVWANDALSPLGWVLGASL